jgi:hypothetical protein
VTKGEKERAIMLENQVAIMTALVALTPVGNTLVVSNLTYHSAKTIAYVQGIRKQ